MVLEFRKPIPVSEAVKRVMNYKYYGKTEYVSINESYGRFLAEDLVATSDVPHFTRSGYDGFAVRSVDTKNASSLNPIELEVIDHIGAGMVTGKEVQAGQAVRIMTGAQMPTECDAVIMLELAKEFERDGKKYIMIKRPVKPGDHVSFQGEEVKKGDLLVKKGIKINPGIQALLATFGYSDVPVAVKPRVGLFATGTELLDVHEPLQPGKIRNSNSYMISAQIERAGAEVLHFGSLPDDFDTCFEAIKKAIAKVDILITTGGVSVGDFDYLSEIYQKLGAEILFNKIAMRPGSVTTVASFEGKLLFGLSGNPSACFVGFELYARPVIRTMLFSEKPHLRKVKATLNEDFPKTNPFTRFVRASVSYEDGRLVVVPSGKDKSNIVRSLAGANSLIILPGGTRGFKAGDEVEVLLLEDQEGSKWPW